MTESKRPLPDDLLAEIDRLAPQLTFLDHYRVLGVAESASDAEIKAAYLRLIQRFHPDRWHARDSSTQRKRMEAIFARANEAYEALRRPDARLEYDRSLAEVRGIAPPAPTPRAPTPPTRPPSELARAKAARLLNELRAHPPAAPKPQTSPTAARPLAAPVAPTAGASGRPVIVVVEDDDALRRMIARVLAELGEVREARDGIEALELCAAAGPLPHLVVTDLMMPRLDGLELARRLKASPRTAHVPVMMLTAKSAPKDLIEGVNAGVRYYVTKPFKFDELKAKAKKAMG